MIKRLLVVVLCGMSLAEASVQWNTPFVSGWNMLSVPLVMGPTFSASDLATLAQSQGLNIRALAIWDGRWMLWVPGLGGFDAPLPAGSALFAFSDNAGMLALVGDSPFSCITPDPTATPGPTESPTPTATPTFTLQPTETPTIVPTPTATPNVALCEFERNLGSTTADQILAAQSLDARTLLVGLSNGTVHGVVGNGSNDVLLTSIGQQGVASWTRLLGTASQDQANAVDVQPDLNFVVGGWSGGNFLGGVNKGSSDAFVFGANILGSVRWSTLIGSTAGDVVYGVRSSSFGVFSCGETFGSLGSDTNAGSNDAFVCRMNHQGQIQWTRQFGSPESNVAAGLAVDADGFTYVTGYSRGTIGGYTSQGDYDAFLAKIDLNGAILWVRGIGTSVDDRAYAVEVLDTSEVVITGYTSNKIGSGTHAGGLDGFAALFDANGTLVRSIQLGTSGNDLFWSLRKTAYNELQFIGWTAGALPGFTSAGGNDVMVLTTDAGLNSLRQEQFGGSGQDFGRSLVLTKSGDRLVVGHCSAAISPDATYVGGTSDGFVVGRCGR